MDKIELLSPAGSMANLKAAVSCRADAVYLGLKKYSARTFATNFNPEYLSEAVRICKSNNIKLYVAMNTLVMNSEIKDFFDNLSLAYSKGIDAVIIQHLSFISEIKKQYPDLKVHISTQAGIMNSGSANLLKNADRLTLARELSKDELSLIRKNYPKELEIFCHGALCVSVSGQCLFSSFLGGRSGNRGRCAQPCRKKYDNQYLLSTKELCLIEKIPEIIKLGVNAVKIEGRMRNPYYVAAATEAYRKAIDSYYSGNFNVPKELLNKLKNAFSREFTSGWFESSEDIFNVDSSGGKSITENETYAVKTKSISIQRPYIHFNLPEIKNKESERKQLMVRAYNKKDALDAYSAGADIVYFDLFDKEFDAVKGSIGGNLFAVTPRIFMDSDKEQIWKSISEKKPDGILAGNLAMLNNSLPTHLDYNLNCFNDLDISYFSKAMPIISPELSIHQLKTLHSKKFAVLVHGKIRLMTLRHTLKEGIIKDDKGCEFTVKSIHNGTEILNKKELGLLGKSSQLVKHGINSFYIDTENKVKEITTFYRKILDGEKPNDFSLKKDYVLGWSYRGVL